MPRLTKEKIRHAKSAGWREGNLHHGGYPMSWPFENIDMCLIYDTAYLEGEDAEKGAKNPYEQSELNQPPKRATSSTPRQASRSQNR